MTPILPDPLAILAEGLADATRRLPTRAAVDARQDRLARRHLPWVVRHSPWTAQRFADAGLPAHRWRELPPVGKPEMMAHLDQLLTLGLGDGTAATLLDLARRAERTRDFTEQLDTPRGRVAVGLSTGTSGAQGMFVVSRDDRVRWAGAILSALFRPFPWALARPQRVAFFLRADGGLYRTAASRQVRIDFFDLLRPTDDLAAALTAARPTLVVGPPSVLLAVARAGGRARPSRVVSVAEVLEDETRDALAEHFGAPVVQVYQATEGLLGLPCRAGQLHLAEEHVHVDLEPVGGASTLVTPVITDLRRRAQPMVRHRLNDLLEVTDGCECGLATRRIVRIAGRQDDALELPGPDGVAVTVWPDFLRGALARVPGLSEFRLVQRSAAGLELQVDPAEVADAARALVLDELERHRVATGAVTLTSTPWRPAPEGTKLRRVVRDPDEGVPC